MKKIIILTILIITTVILSGCINFSLAPTNEKDYDRFIGRWIGRLYNTPTTMTMLVEPSGEFEWTFFENRTALTKNNNTFFWKLNGNDLVITIGNNSFPTKYYFSENDTKLNLGGTNIYGEIYLTKVG